ncbi:tryptophan halogenase family protein [Alteraurantiacibacter aquimixticola]|uniref:Tryptophan 7-halogenase n=1 Tax=Alteraurantiacibacter aquimixticola TaxID=2489173 RepID=A0A4T3F5R6_9SPHN|nr:tryptophan halogenase family protein [Alteraurantiacibacter aquimixticola]TIX50972.1 tryptophan 7-halogenase [Alteraurantiacibacter aquimixticola]
MQGRPVRKVVIAGGGTAGWTVAAALAKNLGELIEIVLVESDAIGTVGVGESTIPTARRFHELLGLDEAQFVRATGASFKLGISFENWTRDGERYFHSFGVTGRSTWMADFQHMWLEARAMGIAGDIGEYSLETQAAMANRFRTGGEVPLNYAYHLDATAYGLFLREFAEPLGVTRIEGRIRDVRKHGESGDIAALELDSGEVVGGDLFIDCTGFRGLLIEDALETGFDDWTHWLSTDRALAVQTKAVGPARPYTRAMAHEAGWQWQIPLQHRVGNGLVYCSEFMSDDEARARLEQRLDGEMLTEPRVIPFRTGTRRKAWNRNCIAIGLSSGFVEPLESTSIHLIMIAVTRLMQLFPFDGVSDALAQRFNDLSRTELEGIRDFIILHYHLNNREGEPFWDRCRALDIPDTLAQRIALFRESATAYQASDELFRIDSWVQVMLGQGLQPQSHHALGRMIGAEKLGASLDTLASNLRRAAQSLPEHQAFLDQYAGKAEAGAA